MQETRWDEVYRNSEVESLPWFSPELDREIKEFLDKNGIGGGKFLDLGTGPGTQAIQLARLSFDVVATDISRMAINKARRRARRERVKVKFVVDDILDTRLKPGQFDFIYDRGVFHTLAPRDRERFVKTIRKIIKPEGIYFLKCFSVKTPGREGPHRFTKEQIKDYFIKSFRILSTRDSIFQGTLEHTPRSLFSVMRARTAKS